jgi:flagellar hook-associated protein 2
MGTISSGIGLISGLDHQQIIAQLMAIEARPRDELTRRLAGLNAQKAAYLDISARITALLSRLTLLGGTSTFQAARATSSQTSVLNATVGAGVQPGAYNFVVRALAATHQLVSRGFASRTAPLSSGTLTIESAAARADNATHLDDLNGQAGVRRGSFKISNGTQQATINLSDALNVQDVLDAINDAGLGVAAATEGDQLVLRDTTGGNSTLRVQEVAGGHTAADLGFDSAHSQGTGALAGRALVYLTADSRLTSLNDGLGLRHALAGGDFTVDVGSATFTVDLGDVLTHTTRLERLNHGQGVRLGTLRITSRNGATADVDLTGVQDIGDVKERLEAAFGGGRISVVLNDGRLAITDSTDISNLSESQRSDLIIEDVSGYAAADLGIAGRAADGSLDGQDVIHTDNVADVLAAINYAIGNDDGSGTRLLTAALSADGHGLTLSAAAGPFTLSIPSGNTSKALFDLGFQPGTYDDSATGVRVLSGLNTVLLKTLNGGAGVTGATMQITANGLTADLDLSDAQTLADVIARINAAVDGGGQSLGVSATLDGTGTRIVVTNANGAGDVTISGDFATSLGLAQSGTTLRSNNLQRRYLAENTRLTDLNTGRGVARGKFKITASSGALGTVDLSATSIQTLGDVIDEINRLNIGVQAGINSTGDGLLLTDTAGGGGTLKVVEDGGRTARDLNLLTAASNNQIDGSYEFKLSVGGGDTLTTLADRITSKTTLARATLLNDGTPVAPYRLSIASLASGAAGALIVDDSALDLGITTLTRPQDARILFGNSAAGGILLTSADNTFEEVVPGLTLTASGVSDDPVTITAERDLETLLGALRGLVEDYNGAVDRIKDYTKYDSETETAGLLQAESALYTAQSRLRRMFSQTYALGGPFSRLSQLGLKFGGEGHLEFDEDAFRDAYGQDPEAVTTFFTTPDTGLAATLKEQVEALTESDGLIERRADALDARKELLQDRIDQLNDRLDRRRASLERQFQAMESALAILQTQQQQISSMASLLPSGALFGSVLG